MYAIIGESGRQFRVQPGDVIAVNRMSENPGETVTLEDRVLMVRTDDEVMLGTPTVEGAKVELEIVEHYRGKKLIAFKMKRRKRCRRKKGHRQELTRVNVRSITVGSDCFSAPVDAEVAEPEVVEEVPAVAEAAVADEAPVVDEAAVADEAPVVEDAVAEEPVAEVEETLAVEETEAAAEAPEEEGDEKPAAE